jgi:hypothetical protein
MKLYIPQLEHQFNIKDANVHDAIKLSRAIRTSLSRAKIKHKLLDYIEYRECYTCGDRVVSDDFLLSLQLAEDVITLDVSHEHSKDREYGKYSVCEACRSEVKKHNPNSVKYLQLAYNISDENECLDIIHGRNKSPFYASNYSDEEEYKKFQSHRSRYDDAEFEKIVEKQLKTKRDRKEQYIEEFGMDAWKEMQKSKDTSSFKYFAQKYEDLEIARKMFERKNTACSSVRPTKGADLKEKVLWLARKGNDIHTLDDFKKRLIEQLETKSTISKHFFLHNLNKLGRSDEYGDRRQYINTLAMDVFDVENVFDLIDIDEGFIEKIRFHANNAWSKSSIYDGFFFRSKGELDLYINLVGAGVEVLNTNKSYEGDGRGFYDLLIRYGGSDHYIELCGSDDPDYNTKQLHRNEVYGSILVSKSASQKLIDDINNGEDISGRIYI